MENAMQDSDSSSEIITKSSFLPYMALSAAVLFWGASFPAVRVAVSLMHPQGVMFCRMSIACIIMVPFIRKLKPSVWEVKDLRLIIPMVIFQPCLYYFLETNALRLTTSSQAGVISAAVPILVALGAWIFLSEKISRKIIWGLMISIAGVTILTLYGKTDIPGENPVLGNIMEFGAMACAAGNMLIVKRLSEKYNPWTLTGMQFGAGFIFFLPGLRYLIESPQVLFNPELIFVLLLLGVFASVGAFGLYNWAMSQVSATRASVFINLVPAVAVFMGWTLLGESLSAGQIIGALLVGFGVLISQNTRKERGAPTSDRP